MTNNGTDLSCSRLLKHTYGNSNHVLGGCPNPSWGGASSCQSMGRGPPKLAKNVRGLTCNISETLHDMELVSPENRYETTQALSVGEVTAFDTAWPWKVKHRFCLVRSSISALAQFLLLCSALFHSALSCGGTTKKWRDTVKKFPSLRAGKRRNCAPPLSNCFRRHCVD